MRPFVLATLARLVAAASLVALLAGPASGAGVVDTLGAPSGALSATFPATLPALSSTVGAAGVGSVRVTTTSVNARGHPTMTSKALFIVPPRVTIRVYRVAMDSAHRAWYLVHVRSRPGWIAGWLTAPARRAVSLWHSAMASSFGVGDGLMGGHMACGGRLTATVLAVAHRTLPCGAHVRIRVGSRSVVAQVLDRGPYVTGRAFDLGPAVCRALRACDGVFRIEWQRAP